MQQNFASTLEGLNHNSLNINVDVQTNSWTSNISAAKYGFQTKCKSLTTAGVLVRCNRCLFQSIRPYTQFILDIGLSYQTLYLSDSVQVKSTKRVLLFQLLQIMVTNIITVIKPAIALKRVNSVPSKM
jgi:hypothetical protein